MHNFLIFSLFIFNRQPRWCVCVYLNLSQLYGIETRLSFLLSLYTRWLPSSDQVHWYMDKAILQFIENNHFCYSGIGHTDYMSGMADGQSERMLTLNTLVLHIKICRVKNPSQYKLNDDNLKRSTRKQKNIRRKTECSGSTTHHTHYAKLTKSNKFVRVLARLASWTVFITACVVSSSFINRWCIERWNGLGSCTHTSTPRAAIEQYKLKQITHTHIQ